MYVEVAATFSKLGSKIVTKVLTELDEVLISMIFNYLLFLVASFPKYFYLIQNSFKSKLMKLEFNL